MRQFLSRSTIVVLGIAVSSAAIAQPTPTLQSTPTLEPQPSPTPVPPVPIPGQSCEAQIIVNGDRILYRTSYISDENLKINGQQVEVDMLKNSSFAAHAVTSYTGNLTFVGTTGTGTPLSFQLNPDQTEIKITHAGRTIAGKCGDTLSYITSD